MKLMAQVLIIDLRKEIIFAYRYVSILSIPAKEIVHALGSYYSFLFERQKFPYLI